MILWTWKFLINTNRVEVIPICVTWNIWVEQIIGKYFSYQISQKRDIYNFFRKNKSSRDILVYQATPTKIWILFYELIQLVFVIKNFHEGKKVCLTSW